MKREEIAYANMSVEAALSLYDSAAKELSVESFHGAARDALIADLLEGSAVGYPPMRFVDVLDCALDCRYSIELPRLADVLLADEDERAAYKQRIVEAFVDGHAKLIEDRATELAEEADEAAAESAHED